jgi:hypothetical protein
LVRHNQLKHEDGLQSGILADLTLALVVRVDLFRVECFEAANLFALAAVELANFVEIVRLH